MQGAGVGLSGVGQQLAAGNLGLQGTAQGIQGAQAGMQGAGVGLSGVQGALGAGQYGLSGLSQANAAAGTLGQLGSSQQAADINAINLQNQLGSQQQQYQQNIINQAVQNYATAQQYPQQQLAFMNAMIRGLPLQTMTTQGYQAAPSTLSQLGGLAATGIGAYGALKAKGGVIKEKHYDVGGAVNYDLEQLAETDAGRAELVKLSKTSPSAIIRRRASQLLADIQPTPGIEAAPSNLPVMTAADGGIMQTGDGDEYAGGGMVAFERGGITSLPVKRYSGVYPEGSFVFEDVYGGEPYGKAAARTPTLGTKEVLDNLEKAKKAEAAAKADRKSTRLNSSHVSESRMPSSA